MDPQQLQYLKSLATSYQASPTSYEASPTLKKIKNPLAGSINFQNGFPTTSFMDVTQIPGYSAARKAFASTGLAGQPLNEAARR